jgi:hypothetical protein
VRNSISQLALAAILSLAMSATALTPAWSQARPGPAHAATALRTLTPAEREQALEAVKARIDQGYVHMDKRAEIIARLNLSEQQGRYATNDPVELASRITADFQAVTHDLHLYIRFEPDWYAASRLPAKPDEAAQENAFEREIARNTNHGLVEMKVLSGNIRYLKIEGFDWIEDETPLAYDRAMGFLKGGSAIVIDLRGNSGGWVQASRYLTSHFVDGDVLFGTFRYANGVEEQQRSRDDVPVGRIKGKPLFILIDRHSRSAAEQVAASIQEFKLGELIGETTAGASYTSDDTAIAPGFRLSVSISEEILPLSGSSWEGVGVKPTVAVDPSTALEVAQLHAIDQLLPKAEGLNRSELLWARPAIAAALSPVTLTDAELKAYVGTYGRASIQMRLKALWLHRPDRDPYRLTPMAKGGLFQASDVPSLRVRILPDRLEVLRADPAMNQTFTR